MNKIIKGSEVKLLRLKKKISQSALAELTEIKQYKLSQFELEKTELYQNEIVKLLEVLNDEKSVEKINNRKKRYLSHKYVHRRDEKRVYKVTERNSLYLKDLKNLFDQHQNKEKKFSCVSIFSGCGGLSLGASAAGFKIIAGIEKDKSAKNIFEKNFLGCINLGSDITKLNYPTIKNALKKYNKLDLMVGGPPCQGFSLAGKRDKNDKRNYLFIDYLNLVNFLKPKVVLLENVELLLSMKNDKNQYVKDLITQEFKKISYDVEYRIVNCANFGIPQNRKRVFFLAIRKSLKKKISFPEGDYRDDDNDLLTNFQKYYSFGDAVSDLPFIESGEKSKIEFHYASKHPEHVINWLWDVAEGKSAHQNESISMRPPSGYNTTYKRQIWSKPASTVQTTFGMISGSNNVHPICTRSLTIREAARIQSFPDQFIFLGNQGEIKTSIGNAVPPLMSYKMCLHILDQIL